MRTTAVVIGAGHAGLAVSRRLTERGVDHVVLERGQVGDAWRTQRWPGLRLLTPSWMLGLPGQPADQPDPDGYLAAPQVADLVGRYAARIGAPVHPGTAVRCVRTAGPGYEVRTDGGTWHARAVVVATGPATVPVVPGVSAAVPAGVAQRTAFDYRGPASLPDGGVLVVGASATGVQLARELRRSGRPVTLAVGEHVRLPRRHRGRDVFWWLHATGVLAERWDEVDDPGRVRRLPSPQLVGSAAPVDLASLVSDGVRLVGRLTTIRDGIARTSGSLRNVCALADLKMARFLALADAWAVSAGVDGDLPPPTRPERTPVPDRPELAVDLTTGDISTVLWATGFRPCYPWLELPVVDRRGRLRHHGGALPDAPGVYAVGLPLLRTRASSYIHGAAEDSRAVADHLTAHLVGG